MFKGTTEETIVSIALLILFFFLYFFIILSLALPFRIFPAGTEALISIIISIVLSYFSVDMIHHLKHTIK